MVGRYYTFPLMISISYEEDRMKVASNESFDEDMKMPQDELPPKMPPLGPLTSKAPTLGIELLVEVIPLVPLGI